MMKTSDIAGSRMIYANTLLALVRGFLISNNPDNSNKLTTATMQRMTRGKGVIFVPKVPN